MGLPAGDVTFVFSDIEGSTRLLKRLGDRYDGVHERHALLLRDAWNTHGGHEVHTEGDSFFVAFTNPADAIAACAEGQRLLAAEPWPDDGVVRVRMGIHSGLASPRNGDYLAVAVNQAKRVSDAAHGGQVLVSEESAVPVEHVPDLSLVPAGRFRLRDFDNPVQLFQLHSPHMDASITAVRAMPAEGHNLVRPATSFIGREDESAATAAALAPGRVVTLAGPGGVGKTRIATEVGMQVAPSWADGVWFVDLAAVEDPVLVASAIADAVGVRGEGAHADRWADVIDHLRARSALVLLDNAESHLDTCATLAAELVAVCTGVGVLTTSRRPLGIGGEVVVRVSPLQGSHAVQLFRDRARSVRSDFALDDDSVIAVAGICERLDGLPLAVEIAAARVGVLEVSEILGGLDDGLQLLRSRDRNLPERQRSMIALLDWSYRLLDEDERTAFRRLSVFGGSFSREAAGAAVAADGLDPNDVAELVWSLVDHSLVVADLAANGTRYRFFETVQRYARGLLDAEGATAATASRLATWFLDRLGPSHKVDRTWIGDTAPELTNLRALIPLVVTTEPEVAQQLACSIGRYHGTVQSIRAGIEEMTLYVNELTFASPSRVAMLTALGDLELQVVNVKAAQEAVDEAHQLRDTVGAPPWDDAGVERTRGEIAIRLEDFDQAIEIAYRALDRDLSIRGRARMWNLLGVAWATVGDFEQALEAFHEELEALDLEGHEAVLSTSHGNVAEVALRLGRVGKAARHQQVSLELALALGQPIAIAYSLIVAARIAGASGDWQNAVALHARADALLDETGHLLYEGDRRESEELLANARAALGVAAFEEANRSGQELGTIDAVEAAKEVLESVPERTAVDPRPLI